MATTCSPHEPDPPAEPLGDRDVVWRLPAHATAFEAPHDGHADRHRDAGGLPAVGGAACRRGGEPGPAEVDRALAEAS